MHKGSNKLQLFSETIIYAILVLLPFHGFLTIWIGSVIGHGLVVRSWKEALLVLVGAYALALVIQDKGKSRVIMKSRAALAIVGFVMVCLIYFTAAVVSQHHLATANAVGLIIDCRFLIFFLVAAIVFANTESATKARRAIKKVIPVPALLVGVFAFCQEVFLPKDFLKHFGFVPPRYLTVLYVAQLKSFVRVRSFLRGPNELGAYLLLPFFMLCDSLKRGSRHPWWVRLFLGLLVLSLIFSYSRSAWLSFIIAAIVFFWSFLRTTLRLITHSPRLLALAVFVVMFVIGVAIVGGAKSNVLNVVFLHKDVQSSQEDSTEAHLSGQRAGLRDFTSHIIGAGLGTSGPASQYSTNTSLPDNYYIQINHEVGTLGLALFMVINYLVCLTLYRQRHSWPNLVILAVFTGVAFSNLFLHNWADDTVSMLVWGIAGWSVGVTIKEQGSKRDTKILV